MDGIGSARLRQGFGGQPSRFEGWLANRSGLAAKVGGARRNRTDDLLLAKQALSQLSYGPVEDALEKVVGLGRLELPTSRLSSARSNQLSYKPPKPRGHSTPQPKDRPASIPNG